MRRDNETRQNHRCMIRFASAAVLLLCTLLLLPVFAWSAPSSRGIEARAAILMDLGSGRILYEQNADDPIPPASLTKVMSMFLIFDAVKQGKVSLTDKVTVSPTAAGTGGSRMHLKKSEQLTLDKILTGMAVSSGNDASMAAAEHVFGDSKNFVAAMNAKAASIGMTRTVFVNPTGLPAKGQVTTARDMMTLAHSYLKTYPDALEYHSQKTLVHNKVQTRNRNPLLQSCPGADGLKSGWINASGYNLITTVKRDDTRLVGVILGAATPGARARENLRLMEAGFAALRDKTTVAQALPDVQTPAYARARDRKASSAVVQAKTGKKMSASKAAAAEGRGGRKSKKVSKANDDAQVATASRSGKRVSVEYSSPKMRVTRSTATEEDGQTSKSAVKQGKKSSKRVTSEAKTQSKGKKALKVASKKSTKRTVTASKAKRTVTATKAKGKAEPKTEAKAKTRSGDS